MSRKLLSRPRPFCGPYGGDFREPGYESEDSGDSRPMTEQEEEEEVEGMPASFEAVRSDLETAGASSEVLDRILKLRQRLETQKQLAEAQKAEVTKDWVNLGNPVHLTPTA